jgi:ABC-type glycerol-3-phosphate transport system substrate-binding protein
MRAVQTPQTTPAGIRASEQDLSDVRILFWHAWGGELEDTLEEIIAEFNRTNQWGITVDTRSYKGVGALGDAFLLARQEGEELPDLLSGFNYQALQWDVGGQVLVDLTTFVNDTALGFSSEEVADFQPVFWSQDVGMVNTPSGRIEKRLGIPLHSSAQVLYYNLTWAEELGYVELPDSPFNLRVQACASARSMETTEDAEASGGLMLTMEAPTLLGWIYAYGGDVLAPQGNGYRFDTEEAARALEFLRGMFDSGCAWVGESLQAAQTFAERGALLYPGSTADLQVQESAMRQAENDDEWTVMAFPSANGAPVITTSGPALSVTQSTPEEELAAWLLIKWLVSPQNQAKWVRASGYYPTRTSTLEFLETDLAGDEHWSAAVELLPTMQAEPGYASWRVVRWALGDVMQELLSPEFEIGNPGPAGPAGCSSGEIHTQVR